ncbi:hypothetical protein M0657_008052 [Pyricularia oryzae]|nr:hypothetical protein M0657_008052 [Pyricularia oryzae]KAI7918933.1 hypothetical protein M9X92_006634 [Pyricularia oryzae]
MPSDDFNADVRTPPTRHVYKGSARLDTTTIGSGLVLAPAGTSVPPGPGRASTNRTSKAVPLLTGR